MVFANLPQSRKESELCNNCFPASRLCDRDLDMRLEAGPLAQAVVPGTQLGHRRPLDRKGEPAIDLRAENDLGEAQFGAGEIRPVADRVGIAIAAERPAVIDPLEGEVQLGAALQHLLHVRRTRASPGLQHRRYPPDRVRYGASDFSGAQPPWANPGVFSRRCILATIATRTG
jgi:hypothetical protein